MTIKRVGVVGLGQMGQGVAEVCLLAGYDVAVRDVSQELLERGRERLEGSMERSVGKGRLEAGDRDQALDRLTATVDLDDLAGCDLVVEAIIENLDDKRDLFSKLDRLLPEHALLASNTSSLTVTELAMSTGRPDRFFGLHFFNPVPVMKLVEVVRTLLTSESTLEQGASFVESLAKTPIRCGDNSGFIVNRLLVPYLLDAVRAYESGIGSLDDIDRGMRLGCGHPMGPFVLMDFIGLDTMHSIANIMFEEYREQRFAPPPLLKQMVQSGRLGRKSGRGFYEYG